MQAAVLEMLTVHPRGVCGMVSQSQRAGFPPGPNLGFVVGKRVRCRASWSPISRRNRRMAQAGPPWVADGSLVYREDTHEGLDAAPDALAGPGRTQLRQDAGPGGAGPLA